MSEFESLSCIQHSFCGIELEATKARLWNKDYASKPVVIRARTMIPQFKFTSKALKHIWNNAIKNTTTSFGEVYGSKYSEQHFLRVKMTNAYWNQDEEQLSQSFDFSSQIEFGLKLTTTKPEFRQIKEFLQNRIDETIHQHSPIEPLDIIHSVTSVQIDVPSQSMTLKSDIVFPFVNLQLTQLRPMKIVSTLLSRKLTKPQHYCEKFQSGFLTLDQRKRVLPLQCSDEMVFQYPLVGVWVSNLPTQGRNILAHPLVWAAWIRYVQSQILNEKISPNPAKSIFLLVNFSKKPRFYEVRTSEEAMWTVLTTTNECAQNKKGEFEFVPVKFLESKQGSSINSSFRTNVSQISNKTPKRTKPRSNSGLPMLQRALSHNSNDKSTLSSLKDSQDSIRFTESPTADQVIMQQTLHLQKLEQQIKELQTVIVGQQHNSSTIDGAETSRGFDTLRHPGVDARDRGLETARDPRLETLRGIHSYTNSDDDFSSDFRGLETARNPKLETMRFETGRDPKMETMRGAEMPRNFEPAAQEDERASPDPEDEQIQAEPPNNPKMQTMRVHMPPQQIEIPKSGMETARDHGLQTTRQHSYSHIESPGFNTSRDSSLQLSRKNSFCAAELPKDLSMTKENENVTPKNFSQVEQAYGLKRDPRMQTMRVSGLKDIQLPKGLETTRDLGLETLRGYETNRQVGFETVRDRSPDLVQDSSRDAQATRRRDEGQIKRAGLNTSREASADPVKAFDPAKKENYPPQHTPNRGYQTERNVDKPYNPLNYSGCKPQPQPAPDSDDPVKEEENSIYIPKIVFECSSDSSDDEEIQRLQKKYLKAS